MESPLQCLEHGPKCEGEVEYRTPLTETNKSFPRCKRHWELRLDSHEDHLRRDAAYRNVDYLDAGERYDED